MSNLIVYESKDIVVIESEPACRTIQTCARVQRDGPKYERCSYYLSFPYMVFVIPIQFLNETHSRSYGMRVGFRNKKLTNEDQDICYPNLYNIYADTLRVCMLPVIAPTGNELYRSMLNMFWQTTFTLVDALHQMYNYKQCYSSDERVASYSKWQKNTLENPEFITDVKWPFCNNLENIIQMIRAGL